MAVAAPSTARRYRDLIAPAAGLVGGAGLVTLFDPEHRHVPLCPFHAMTGLQCPFCGSLRAISETVRGHLVTAVHDNLLLFTVLPVLLILAARRDADGRPVRMPRIVVAAAVAVIGAYWLVRNLPGFAFLRPV